MAAATATETKKRTPARTESAAPTPPVEVHWAIEKLLGERFGADLLLTLSRTDRVDHQAERDALILQIVREVVEQLPTLESRDRVEQIRAELAGLDGAIQHTQDEYQKASYKRSRFDASTSEDPWADPQRLDADVSGWAAKEEAYKTKRTRLTHALGQARTAIDSEIVGLVREGINRKAAGYRKRREMAARELIKHGQELLDEIAQGDSGWRELQDDQLAQLVLRKVGESR